LDTGNVRSLCLTKNGGSIMLANATAPFAKAVSDAVIGSIVSAYPPTISLLRSRAVTAMYPKGAGSETMVELIDPR
jgi:hypothetical protein